MAVDGLAAAAVGRAVAVALKAEAVGLGCLKAAAVVVVEDGLDPLER